MSAELAAEEARLYAESIVETVREPLLVLDADLKIISANRNFYKTFKVTPGETIGSFIYDLGNKQWDIPKLRELLEEVLPEKEAFDDFEVAHNFLDIGYKIMLLNARQIYRKDIGAKMILLAIEDITERRDIENGLEKTRKELETTKISEDEAREYAESIINTVREPLIALDHDLRVITASHSFYVVFKVKPEETVGQLIYDLGNKQWDIPKLRELLETILPEKTTFDNYEVEHDFAAIGRRTMLLNARQIKRAFGKERIILLAIEDITERKRLESLLEESEERYRRLFETASDGIVLLEKSEGKITHANPATEKMLGYTNNDCIGNILQDIGILLDKGDFQTTIQNLNKRGILNYDDVSVITKFGQHIDTDIYLVDRARLVQCNIRDITERKRSQDKLKQSEEYFKAIIENSSDIIFIVDKLGTITYASPSIERVLGYGPDELIGKRSLDLIVSDDKPRAIADFGKALLIKEALIPNVFRIRDKSGTERILEGFGKNLLDNPVVAGFVMNVRDITERKRAEDNIKQQTDAMEAAMDGMALLNKDGKYIYLNKAHVKIYGYVNAGELIGKSWRILYDADEVQRFEAAIMPEFGQKGYWQGEALGMKKDGTKFSQELSLTTLGSGGLICIVRNITERKRTGEALQTNKAQLSNALEIAHLGHWEYDVANDLFTFNDQFYKIFRTTVEKVGGYTMHSSEYAHRFVHPDDMNVVGEETRKAIETTDPHFNQQIEHRILYADGMVGYITVRFFIVKDSHGRTVKTYGVNQDITERREAEEALRNSEGRLRTLVQTIPDIVWLKDKDGIYLSCNTMFARFFGAKETDIVGKTDYDFVDRELADSFREHDNEAITAGKPTSKEDWITFADDGHRALMDTIKTPMYDTRGTLIGVLGIGRDITNRKRAEEQLQHTLESLRRAVDTTIHVMVSAVEIRDPYTSGHQIRSADLARAIATEMGLPQEKIDGIRMASSIHDIGKLSVPAEILSKPTKLSEIEFSLIKEHACRGFKMLKNVESPWPLAEIVYQHHERMDGSGYPRNLKGNDILIEARILNVADVVEAMASHRPYRPALGINAALEEIEKNKGTLYDADAADACIRLFRERGFRLEGT
jgi:PAS domain S-box-containing protein